MTNQSQVKCPNCGTSIDVQDILAHQVEEQYKQQYQEKEATLAQQLRDFQQKKNELFKQLEDSISDSLAFHKSLINQIF